MKSLIMNAEMVRAYAEGRKDVTRRPMKVQPDTSHWKPEVLNTPKEWRKQICLGSGHHADPDMWCLFNVGDKADAVPYFGILAPLTPGERIYIVEFVPITFGEGKYAVGSDGNVYDISKDIPVKRKAYLSHNGYEQINLRYKGKDQAFRVNRLVCEAFYGKPLPHETECRHMDGNRRNNWPENLDWGTRKQNALDASSCGALNGQRKAQSKLSPKAISDIRSSGEPQDVLAKRYGVGQPAISKVRAGKRHVALPEKPPRNHPEWKGRKYATVVSIRPERVQEISNPHDEVLREGWPFNGIDTGMPYRDYSVLWDRLYPGSWERNDWVWRIELTKPEGV